MDDLIGTLILAPIYGAAGRWVVADPAPMSPWMIVTAGVGGALLWDIPGAGGGTSLVAIPVLWIFIPTLLAGVLIALYRTFTWRADATDPQPVGNRWLANGALASVLFFPGTYLVIATLYGLGGVSPDNRVALELAAGVSLSALLLIATHWSSSRWWVRRARVPLTPSRRFGRLGQRGMEESEGRGRRL